MGQNQPSISRVELEHWPENWRFPAGASWITGWLDTERDTHFTDIRAWVGNQLFLGLIDMSPRHDARRQKFAFLIEPKQEASNIRIETWDPLRSWTEIFKIAISVHHSKPDAPSAAVWLGRLPRFTRTLYRDTCGVTVTATQMNEALRSALAQPLNTLPVPPFVGALETPLEDGYCRNGKLLVSGWLAHQTRSIPKLTARVSGANDAVLVHGLQRRDAGHQFPTLTNGANSHFLGLVNLPEAAVEPCLLLIFAETDDGIVSLVFARRFSSWNQTLPALCEGPSSRWQQLRNAGALIRSTKKHGLPWLNPKVWWAIARLPEAMAQMVQTAEEGAFSKSTPLSLFLSSIEDHEPSPPKKPTRSRVRNTNSLNVLFVVHCDFSCASALHVIALANELFFLGHDCIAAVPERLDTLADHDDHRCRGILHSDAMDGVLFPNGKGPDIIHAWTTRESVRLLSEHLHDIHTGAKLVIHLEDNETQVSAGIARCTPEEMALLPDAELDRLIAPNMSHPRKGARFLRKAQAVTLVIETLKKWVPHDTPTHVITPASDPRYFPPQQPPDGLQRLIKTQPDEKIIFYGGNVHHSNALEMRRLYAAILRLNQIGLPTKLIRTGLDQVDFLGDLAVAVAPFVEELGKTRHHRNVAPLMALADLFVQPGSDNEFNAFRFPSKLPEFFSCGRPVVLPRTNLGRVTRHRVDAYVLETADCPGIVEAVKVLRTDQALYDQLCAGATAFAARHFAWKRSALSLANFYESIATRNPGIPE